MTIANAIALRDDSLVLSRFDLVTIDVRGPQVRPIVAPADLPRFDVFDLPRFTAFGLNACLAKVTDAAMLKEQFGALIAGQGFAGRLYAHAATSL
jgi:hypothetical protein